MLGTVASRPGGNVTAITPHVAGLPARLLELARGGPTADDAMHQLRYRQCRCQRQPSQRDHDRVGQLFSYAIVGVAPPGTDFIYFAFVNYTTLGYGDVTPLRRWQLLGPMTAMNGVLLFGWSAGIFAVLRKAMIPGPTED